MRRAMRLAPPGRRRYAPLFVGTPRVPPIEQSFNSVWDPHR
jgi:hypothetical protein